MRRLYLRSIWFLPLICNLICLTSTAFQLPPYLRRRSNRLLPDVRVLALGASNEDNGILHPGVPRRKFFLQTSLASLALILPLPSQARGGLVQFPCLQPLGNTYYFLRVGETLLEEENILSTNPLFLTNREAALSEKGAAQIQEACQTLQKEGVLPTVVRYSFAAACLDTATILGDELQVTQDRLIPEFFFLDPRAIGQWDKQPLDSTEPAVWALDVDEAKKDGQNGRPPANDDSTPHETLGDHAIRLRQLFSACETVYSGDTVVLVFPDGTGPALLSCMIAGIPFNRVHELELQPGEIRRNVTRDTTLQLLEDRQSREWKDPYQAKVEQGRTELKQLLSIDFVQQQNDQNGPLDTPPAKRLPRPTEEPTVSAVPEKLEATKVPKQLLTAVPEPSNAETPKASLASPVDKQMPPPKPPTKKSTRVSSGLDQKKSTSVQAKESQPPSGEIQQSAPGLLGSMGILGLGLVGAFLVAANDPTTEETTTTTTVVQEEMQKEKGKIEDDEDIMAATITSQASQAHPMSTLNGDAKQTISASDAVIAASTADEPRSTDESKAEQPNIQDDNSASTTIVNVASPSTTPTSMEEEETEQASSVTLAAADQNRERLEVAEKAMEKYLEADDGGDAWLQSLTAIITEEDDSNASD